MKTNTLELGQNKQENKAPKRRHKEERPTHSHTQKSHRNTKWEVIMYTQRAGLEQSPADPGLAASVCEFMSVLILFI